MLALEFDIDKLKSASYEDGIEEGRAEGLAEGRKEIILAFLQSGISMEQIAKTLKLPEEKILEILEK